MWKKLQSHPVEGNTTSYANTIILYKVTKRRRIGASAYVSPAWSVHGDGEFMQMERFSPGYREFSPLIAFWTRLTLTSELTATIWPLHTGSPGKHHPEAAPAVGLLKDHCREPWVPSTVLPSMRTGGCVTCNAALYFGKFILQDMGMHLPKVMPLLSSLC